MNALLACAFLVSAHVQAQRFDLPRRLEARSVAFGNETASYTNSTSTSVTSSSSQDTQSRPPLVTGPDSSSTAPVKPSSTGQSSPIGPPGGQGDPTNGSPADGDDGGACQGDNIMTYFGSVYPTVYVTVTESYEVTLSAANATMTDTETLITPHSPCHSTVVPLDNPDQPVATIQATINVPISSDPIPDDGTTSFPTIEATNATRSLDGPRMSTQTSPPRPPKVSASAAAPGGRPHPAVPAPDSPSPEQTHVYFSPSVVASTIYNTAPYTSTVVITKKTPVPVLPQTPEPPPVFAPPPQAPPSNRPNPPNQPSGDRPGPGPGSGGQQPGGPNSGGDINTLIQVPGGSRPAGAASDLLESVIKSLLTVAASAVPAAPQTTLNNVPVAVRPSSVVIGNSVVPIPTGREEAVVSEGGQVFTVRAQEIAAPSTTVAFGPLIPQGAISVPPTRVTAAPGVIVEVAGSTAIVDGTTFRLNNDFSTVVTVSGERISIGPSGIGLPSTTIAAGRITAAPQRVQTVGDVTFTISGSSVIISGNTYGIATDSPTVTTEFSGERVSIGPGGVGFDSTTVRPTMEQTSTREDTAEATSSTGGDGNNDGDGDGSENAASAFLMSPFAMLVSLVALVVAL